MSLHLTDPSLLEHRAFVAGTWRAGDKTFAVTNPAASIG